jgi:hypothetical protein
MEYRRARDIDEIERLAVEHQIQIVIDANVPDEVDSRVAPGGNWIVNRNDIDVVARAPADEMGARRHLAESGNRSAQHRLFNPGARGFLNLALAAVRG